VQFHGGNRRRIIDGNPFKCSSLGTHLLSAASLRGISCCVIELSALAILRCRHSIAAYVNNYHEHEILIIVSRRFNASSK
jgi:hypothetical protein